MDIFALVASSDSAFTDVAPHLEDATALEATQAQFAAFGTGLGGIVIMPTAVTVEGDTATITYDILLSGNPFQTDNVGNLELIDGVWTVRRAVFCEGMAAAGISCPS